MTNFFSLPGGGAALARPVRTLLASLLLLPLLAPAATPGRTAGHGQGFGQASVPTLSSIVPATGAAGTTGVVITGTDLSGATALTVNGVAATITATTATTVTFTVPAGTGPTPSITVTTPGGTSAAFTGFTVQLKALAASPTTPLPNANAAPVAGSTVAVGFTEAVSAGSAGKLAVFGSIGGGRKAGTVSGGGSSTLSFSATTGTPVSSFQRGEVVSVSVPSTVLGAGGLAATPFVYQFTTGGLTTSAGTFNDRLDLGLSGRDPRHVRWADLDGDGRPDLLVANKNTSQFSVNRNLTTTAGTPSFGAASFFSMSPGPSYEPYAAAAGDADGDGRPDVATANRRQSSVSVRLNTSTSGSLSFAAFAEWPVGGTPQEVQWADLDGDAKLDLVTVNNIGNNVSVLRNTSTGPGSLSFEAAVSFSLSGSGAGSDNLRVADLDGDGRLDLVLNNASGTFMRVMRNNSTPGTMSFVAGTDVPVQAGSTPYGPALADVDGDGRPDIVAIGSNQPNAYVALNTSTPGSINFAGYAQFAAGAGSAYLTAADLNGDGKPDLALLGGTLKVLLNTSTGPGNASFGAASSYPLSPGSNGSGLMAADADNDGTLDLTVANAGTNSLSVFINTPNAPTITSFTPPSGTVGTSVNLTGTNLSGATAVTFSGSSGNVVTTGFTVASATSITGVVVPAGAITGPVTVTTPIGTNLLASPVFTVTPRLSSLGLSAGSLNPAFAPGTTAYTLSTTAASLTVTPTNAQTSGGTITVNGTTVASGSASGALALAIGSNTITVVVNPNGAGTALTYTLTVTRTCAATALARNVSLALDASGNATLTPAAVDNGSSSTCGAVTLALSQTAFTCANVGTPVAVTLTVTDGYGSSATANATITVLDTTPPVFASNGAGTSASPFTNLNGARGVPTGTYWFRFGGSTFQGYVDGTTDGGGWVEIMNYVHAAGTNPGTNARSTSLPVQTSATLGANESAVAAAWGHATPALVNSLDPLEVRFSGQTSGHARIMDFKTSLPAMLSYLRTGTGNTNGLEAAGSFTALPGHTALLPASRNNGVANQGNAALTDFPFMRDNIGYWSVRGYGLRWEMDDFSTYQTNNADGYARSTIHRAFARGGDTPAPGNNLTATASAGLCGTTVDLTGTQPVSDNCVGTVVTFSPASGSFFAVGTTAVTATATDASGNTATSTFTVTVTEPGLPTAVARNVTVTLDASGSATVTAAQVNNGSSDNCTPAASLTLSVTPSSFTCANLGPNPVTLTVTDASGNQRTATATVTVAAPTLASTTWTGAVSTDWTACANWQYGLVPSASVGALLPGGLLRYPSLPAGTYAVMDLTVASGASISAASTATLRLSGSFANNGGTVALSGPVVFTGTADIQTVGGSAGTSFGAVTIDKANGGVTLSQNLSISTSLTMTSGILTTGTAYKVALRSTATLSETATSYVSGLVETNRNLNAAGTGSSFGGLGLTLTPAVGSAALPGLTFVRRITDSPVTGLGSNAGIGRYFDIQPAVDAGLDVTLRLSYAERELNGIAENKLLLFKSESGLSGPWARVDYASYDAAANTVTREHLSRLSLWTLGNADAPLPVELLSFTAEQQGAAVALAWRTASEKNSARFETERSTDGQAFERLGTVAAQGTKATPTSYQFLDAKYPGGAALLYYRLRQVDLDGSFSYSPVRVVSGAREAGALRIFPNPAHRAATVAGLTAGAVVNVFDALGRAVAYATADAGGTAQLTLPAGLAAGVYIVRSGAQAQRLTVE